MGPEEEQKGDNKGTKDDCRDDGNFLWCDDDCEDCHWNEGEQ